MECPTCGTANEPGRKFCGECGASLAAPCPTCGAANAPGVKFCGECGTDLASAAAAADAESAEAPTAERRLVSVLFADLVGFTTLSESRDAETVRDLLSRYFETASQIIGSYGGTVEKFIGDAVDGRVGRADRLRGRRRASGAQRARPRRGRGGHRATRSARTSSCAPAS